MDGVDGHRDVLCGNLRRLSIISVTAHRIRHKGAQARITPENACFMLAPSALDSISARSFVVVLQLRIVMFLYSGTEAILLSLLLVFFAARREKYKTPFPGQAR